jgi:hypothetical protein
VLAVLARANTAFTGRQVHRLVGRYSEAGVRNVLNRLVEQGIVDFQPVGPSYTYRLNRDHLATPHIVALALLFSELLTRIRSRLGEWNPAPAYAALFGSGARGDMRIDSDIDIFVVRPDRIDDDDDQWGDQLYNFTRDVTRWTGNDTRPLELGETQARRALRRGEPVIKAIRTEGLHLAGPADYFRSAPRPPRKTAVGARRARA